MKQNIIAVDFDGTLCENKWPEIGMPNEEANIYKSRRGHKLDEWCDFCKWIETLPYSELIAGKTKEN